MSAARAGPRDGDFREVPLVVLIDERSASAAEALASSLQDHDRALLVGRRSFGKALMQSIFFLPSGDIVWLTVGRVITPSGRGIVPDIVVPIIAPLPVWWSAAADSGFDDAVSDSVAQTLPATPAARGAWLTAESEWRAKLLPPFLSRVRARLSVSAATDSLLDQRLARILAARAAEVRWGPDAREEFVLRNDRTIRVATEQFPRLRALLAAPKGP